MPSVVELCNIALSHVGSRSKIAAMDEGSPEALACGTHFAQVRDATLGGFDWNFARLTAALADLGSPPQRWACRYAVPSDCLRIRRLNDVPVLSLPETFYEMAGDKDETGAFISVILTNEAPLSAIYTARVDDPGRWDADFSAAFCYGLAARICYEITGKSERADTLFKMWQGILRDAKADSANEGSQPNRLYVPEELQARAGTDCWPYR